MDSFFGLNMWWKISLICNMVVCVVHSILSSDLRCGALIVNVTIYILNILKYIKGGCVMLFMKNRHWNMTSIIECKWPWTCFCQLSKMSSEMIYIYLDFYPLILDDFSFHLINYSDILELSNLKFPCTHKLRSLIIWCVTTTKYWCQAIEKNWLPFTLEYKLNFDITLIYYWCQDVP